MRSNRPAQEVPVRLWVYLNENSQEEGVGVCVVQGAGEETKKNFVLSSFPGPLTASQELWISWYMLSHHPPHAWLYVKPFMSNSRNTLLMCPS